MMEFNSEILLPFVYNFLVKNGMRKTAGMLINEANFERKEEWDICNIIDDIKLKDAFERSGKKGKDEKAGRRIEPAGRNMMPLNDILNIIDDTSNASSINQVHYDNLDIFTDSPFG